MRKTEKQELLNIVDGLKAAHKEIIMAISQGQNELAKSMLGDCQDYAINLGDIIEKFEGEGNITIPYLEQYCETLYLIHESLHDVCNVDKITEQLAEKLDKVRISVEQDILEKKEVVFFPYKAAMWDSLESIYLAAKEDPQCDAYCVPIPYFDLNQDRTFGEMHYEGEEYPENIKIINWQNYNFEERKPDTIYIHNPYDNWNFVTSVHPRFYSENLKKYTSNLIYIPYFVLSEIEPDNQIEINNIKHFCFLPGVINANKVIVQSEEMRQIYINEFIKAASINGLSGDYVNREKLEEKILGLGSPKFEKVKNTKKEDLIIPDSWLRKIKKADGSWKKIIFYNTSVGALLENNEKMIDKMKNVFNFFCHNNDEITLLWRPHPLIENTIKSMRPALWKDYEKLVKDYEENSYGIYDNSSDLYRAIAVSDEYYGDISSLIEIYKRTYKPVMIQNVSQKYYDIPDRCEITVNDYIDIDGEQYFVAVNTPAFFKTDKFGKTEIILVFNEENSLVGNLYTKLIEYQGKILLVPCHAKCFVIYDVLTGKYQKRQIPNLNKQSHAFGYFNNAIIYKKYAIVVGYTYRGIILIDMDTFNIQVFDNWYEEYAKRQTHCFSNLFGTDICIINDSLFIPIQNSNNIMEFNLKEYKAIFHKVGDENCFWRTLCFDGSNFWLTGVGNGYTRWNINTEKIDQFTCPIEQDNRTENYYIKSWYDGENLCLLFDQNKSILKISTKIKNKFEVIKRDRNELISKEIIMKIGKDFLNTSKVKYENIYIGMGLAEYVKHNVKKIDN